MDDTTRLEQTGDSSVTQIPGERTMTWDRAKGQVDAMAREGRWFYEANAAGSGGVVRRREEMGRP